MRPIEWTGARLRVLDQRLLPARVEHVELDRWQDVVSAIQSMQVRGAPAIGVAGAYGVALAAASAHPLGSRQPSASSSPSPRAPSQPPARPPSTSPGPSTAPSAPPMPPQRPAEAADRALAEAQAIESEDLRANMAIGAHGAALLPQDARVLTHCNTGALATAGYGTALGVVRAAWEQGNLASVVATETRPLLQGARLTRVGARAGRHPRDPNRRQRRGIRPPRRQHRRRGRRRRPHRRQRRRRQQDRHLRPRRPREGPRRPVLRRRAFQHRRPRHPLRRRHPRRAARRRRGRPALGVQAAPDGVDVANPAFDITPPSSSPPSSPSTASPRPPMLTACERGA